MFTIFDDRKGSCTKMRLVVTCILMIGLGLLSGCSVTPPASDAEATDPTLVAIQTEPSERPAVIPTEKTGSNLQETFAPHLETPAVPIKEQPEEPKAEPVSMSEAVEAVSPPEATPYIPADEELVRVKDYIPSIFVDLKYASKDNFTGEIIYDFTEPMLRYGTVKKLAAVQEALLDQGYSLMIWDAYRPTSAQFRLWEICPDATYVANPNKGASSHSRGNTIDVTLVRSDGGYLEMPTGFDDFTTRADRDYSDVSGEAAQNALLLEQTMASCGFQCYSAEWWHYSDVDSYSVIQE